VCAGAMYYYNNIVTFSDSPRNVPEFEGLIGLQSGNAIETAQATGFSVHLPLGTGNFSE
jgi:hypothetical protein